MAENYENLRIWKDSIELGVSVYMATKRFPKEEAYGLTSQLRRAAVSISSNIAEGAARNSRREFMQFISISLGSLNEVESQLYIAHRLGYISEQESLKLTERVKELGRLLGGFRKYLRTK